MNRRTERGFSADILEFVEELRIAFRPRVPIRSRAADPERGVRSPPEGAPSEFEEAEERLEAERLAALLHESGLSEGLRLVAELLGQGKQPAAVARELGVSRKTVYERVKQMRQLLERGG